MPELEYSVADVFTEEPLRGNPLAVVSDTCGLSKQQMQAIAREFDLSETTFIERRAAAVEREAGVRVDRQRATQYLRQRGAPWFYFLAPTDDQDPSQARYRARMQFDGGGDPAIGSAAGCAISYL